MIAIQNINTDELSNTKPTVQDLANFRIFLRHHVYDSSTINLFADWVKDYCGVDVYATYIEFTIYATVPCGDCRTINKPAIYRQIFGTFRSIMITEFSQKILYAINESKLSEKRKKIYKNIMYELSTTGMYKDLLLDVAITVMYIVIHLL